MASSTRYLIFFVLAQVFSASGRDCIPRKHNLQSKRIINGYEISQGTHPYVVAIYERNSHICGGTLISPIYIITAAHCVDDGKRFSILAGTVDLNQPGFRREIVNITLHPEYGYDFVSVKYDIAVAKLESPLPLIRRRIMYVKLPEFSTKVPQEWGTVVGWGDQEDRKKRATYEQSRLMGVQLVRQDCNTTEYYFCLGSPDGKKDSCYGDSGGPFFINKTLYGIVSHSLKAYCASGFPGIYVNVPYMINWIKKAAEIRRCIMCPLLANENPDEGPIFV